MNWMIKSGLLLVLIMVVSELIILFGRLVDQNGMIGASIVVISCFGGVAMAFFVRGRQWNQMQKGTLPRDGNSDS
jgi:hypothetical protein